MQLFVAKRLSRLHPDRITWILIALAVLGLMHILIRTSTYGAVLGGDGVGYVSIAENLIAGEGLQDFRGVKLLPWPPFFPLLLAALGLVGIEPLQAGRLVNAAAFGLIILLSGLYLRRTLMSPLFTVGTALVVMTSVPFTHFASHLMTETVFCLFTLLALMQLDAFLNRRPARSFLAWAAIFTALASVTRYAGIAVIMTGALLLLLHPQRSLIVRLKDVVVYGVISSMPVGGGVRTQLGTLRDTGQGETPPKRPVSIRLADPDKPDIRTGTVSRTLAELVRLSPVDSRTGWYLGGRRPLHSCHDRGSRQAAHQFQVGIGTPIWRFCLGVHGLHDGSLALG